MFTTRLKKQRAYNKNYNKRVYEGGEDMSVSKETLEDVIGELRGRDHEALVISTVNTKIANISMQTFINGNRELSLFAISNLLIELATDADKKTGGIMTAEDVFRDFSELTWKVYQEKKKDN